MPSLAPLRFDREKAENGVWVEVTPGLRVLIARMPNSRLEQRLAKVSKAQQRSMRYNANAEALKAVMIDAVAHCVLLGWEGLTEDDNVTPVPYSVETAVKQLTEVPEFFRFVVETAQDNSLYQDDSLGNSSNT
jgi:hypothetical protein